MKNQARYWFLMAIVIAAAVGIGFGCGYWYWTQKTEQLAVMSAIRDVKLHANLLRQIEGGDIERATEAHRQLLRIAGVTLEVLVPPGSRYANDPEVEEARRMLRERFPTTEQ